MSKLSKQRAKEKFLSTIEMVDKELVLEEIKKNDNKEDLYTYFTTLSAFNTETISDKDINEFVSKAYADWYFYTKIIGT